MYGRFRDRSDAGRSLANALDRYAGRPELQVLALPRGGVPVAYEVARALSAPLDVFLVRKLGVPGQRELAMGAIASGGIRVLNDDVVRYLQIPEEAIERVAAEEERELARREAAYRGSRQPHEARGRTIILIDDGLATGASIRAAVAALKRQRPSRIVVAVPVAAESTCAELRPEVDELVCLMTPEPFSAVGLWYEDFSETSDEQVRELLEKTAHQTGGAAPAPKTEELKSKMRILFIRGRQPPPAELLKLVSDASTSMQELKANELVTYVSKEGLGVDRLVFWAGQDEADVHSLAVNYAAVTRSRPEKRIAYVTSTVSTEPPEGLMNQEWFIWPRDADKLELVFKNRD